MNRRRHLTEENRISCGPQNLQTTEKKYTQKLISPLKSTVFLCDFAVGAGSFDKNSREPLPEKCYLQLTCL